MKNYIKNTIKNVIEFLKFDDRKILNNKGLKIYYASGVLTIASIIFLVIINII